MNIDFIEDDDKSFENDLHDLDSDDDDDDVVNATNHGDDGVDEDLLGDLDDDDEDIDLDAELDTNDATSKGKLDSGKVKEITVKDVATLRRSKKYIDHMEAITSALTVKRTHAAIGSIENDPEYQLVIDTNKLLVTVADEMFNVYKFVIDVYKNKFPDLDTLVPNPSNYVKVVKRIGNETDMTLVKLDDLLPAAAVMTVTMAGSGKDTSLTQSELNRAMEGCDEVLELEKNKDDMLNFVSSRMDIIAPNITSLTGPMIAAQLVGDAGGLQELSRMPACNIEVLGKQKKAMAGYGVSSGLIHTGYIYNTAVVQVAPAGLRKKANRLMSNKVKLAASVDASSGKPTGGYGLSLKEGIEKQLEKLAGPSKGKTKKTLPVPVEKSSKRRGGKRARKMKELFAQTELRKQLNRVSFAEANDMGYADDAMGISFGMLGKEGSGQLRVGLTEMKLLGVKTKKQKTKHNQNSASGTSTSMNKTGGTQTSLSFTPIQGFELENPESRAAKVKEANEKYFGATSGFISVRPNL